MEKVWQNGEENGVYGIKETSAGEGAGEDEL